MGGVDDDGSGSVSSSLDFMEVVLVGTEGLGSQQVIALEYNFG